MIPPLTAKYSTTSASINTSTFESTDRIYYGVPNCPIPNYQEPETL